MSVSKIIYRISDTRRYIDMVLISGVKSDVILDEDVIAYINHMKLLKVSLGS